MAILKQNDSKLRITWVKSSIGYKPNQTATIKALGFHRLNETIERPDNDVIRGMIFKVKHLVSVTEAEKETTPQN